MNNKKDLLRFKYGVSRGVNSYGYRIVSLYLNGEKKYSTNGGGYDMRGTVFASYLNEKYVDRLKTLPANYGSHDNNTGYYGLCHYEDNNKRQHQATDISKTFVNGMCGMSEMIRIAKAISLEVEYLEDDILLVTDTNK